MMSNQINQLSMIDLNECEDWMKNTSGWGDYENNNNINNTRIMVSGDDVIDKEIVHQHNLYKATGSIEAQARIDQYILPCIMHQTLGKPFQATPSIRDKIPGYMWKEMTRKTDIIDVLQYYTLPDLGEYIKERMISHSTLVPTYQFTPVSSNAKNTQLFQHNDDDDMIDHVQQHDPSHGGTIGCASAFSHACCHSSSKTSDDACISIPSSCTSIGCMHGSIISLLIGSVMPLCKRASQCRRLHATHAQVR